MVEPMRSLHYVGPGEEGNRIVVETADGTERFELVIDENLRSAVRSDLPRFSSLRAEPSNDLGPREIQMRVRAGESPAQIAEESGMDVVRVQTFARPVIDERARITTEARRANARRNTAEGEIVEFGEAVDARFTAHGLDPAAVAWDAYRREDAQWVISATWRGGDADRTALWALSLAARSIVPLDETAADLLSDRPIRPVIVAPEPEWVASPDSLTGPVPTSDQFPPEGNIWNTGGQPPIMAPLYGQPSLLPDYEEPLIPMQPAPEVPERHDESDEQKAARARIPSWDDILLGVRRKRD
jgi:Protein of unknown function (DUF3071)